MSFGRFGAYNFANNKMAGRVGAKVFGGGVTPSTGGGGGGGGGGTDAQRLFPSSLRGRLFPTVASRKFPIT